MQDLVQSGLLKINKIVGEANPSEVFTEFSAGRHAQETYSTNRDSCCSCQAYLQHQVHRRVCFNAAARYLLQLFSSQMANTLPNIQQYFNVQVNSTCTLTASSHSTQANGEINSGHLPSRKLKTLRGHVFSVALSYTMA